MQLGFYVVASFALLMIQYRLSNQSYQPVSNSNKSPIDPSEIRVQQSELPSEAGLESDVQQETIATQPSQVEEPESMSNAQLHLDLSQLTSSSGSEEEIRGQLRKLVKEHASAIGVAHVIRDNDGSWDLKPHHATGRVPRRQDFVERFAKSCDTTMSRNSIQAESFLGLEVFYTPIKVFGAREEVLLVLARRQHSSRILFIMEIVSAYFGVWLKGRATGRNDWKLTSLAALIELVSEIEQQSFGSGSMSSHRKRTEPTLEVPTCRIAN